MSKSYRKIFKSPRRWVINGILLLSILALAYWCWVPPGISGRHCGLANNAAWISVDWTSLPVNEADVKQLAQIAAARKLRYLFPFTTYVKSDGSFSPSYTHAAEFVAQFRRFNEDTLLLAWIGMPLQWVNLADETTRQQITTFVAQLVREAHFDGVHLNAEPILNNNADYLVFLEEMGQVLGPEYMISIAGSQWISSFLDSLPLVNDGGARWNCEYYQAVATRVNQLAVMAYDSPHSQPFLYRLWLREQVRGLSKCLHESDAELLIGISISREHTETHKPEAENMSTGLAGICAGLAGSGGKTQGIAIYASWEADSSDWQLWEEWVKE